MCYLFNYKVLYFWLVLIGDIGLCELLRFGVVLLFFNVWCSWMYIVLDNKGFRYSLNIFGFVNILFKNGGYSLGFWGYWFGERLGVGLLYFVLSFLGDGWLLYVLELF